MVSASPPSGVDEWAKRGLSRNLTIPLAGWGNIRILDVSPKEPSP